MIYLNYSKLQAMKKSIVLCADDYGQAPAISFGILDLLQKGRLSAISCMVNTEYWAEHAEWLTPFHHKIDIGLHFNLTHGQPLSAEYRRKHGENFFPLGKVLTLAFLHSLSESAIEAELNAQLDSFQNKLGFLPNHIDGHQHIHQFPLIRNAILNVYERRLRPEKTYIRVISGSLKPADFIRHVKKVIVHASGSAAFGKLLTKHQIPHNSTFAGIYSFDLAAEYPDFFPGFLESVGENGLIMCHPGFTDPEVKDSIARARYAEYQYLSGERMIEDCRARGVAINRFYCS